MEEKGSLRIILDSASFQFAFFDALMAKSALEVIILFLPLDLGKVAFDDLLFATGTELMRSFYM